MTDDFTPLNPSEHWLGWLGDDPALAVRSEIESILRQQVPIEVLPTSLVEWEWGSKSERAWDGRVKPVVTPDRPRD